MFDLILILIPAEVIISAVARFDANGGLETSADGFKLKAATAGQGLELASGVYNVRTKANEGIAIDADELKLDIGSMPAMIASDVAASDLMAIHDVSGTAPKLPVAPGMGGVVYL